MKGTPSINSFSKKLAEKKLLESSMINNGILTTEVYDRLYDIGKKR